MKIRSLLILAIAVLWPLTATAQINFPIGVWSGWVDNDKAETVYRGADTCGINIINLCAAPEELQNRLSLLKSIGQKAMITAAWAGAGDSSVTRHNLMRLSGGVYRRQEDNNTYYGRADRTGYYKRFWLPEPDSQLLTRVGHYDGNAWACTTADTGYALFWDAESSAWHPNSSDYVKYRNHNCREPWQNMPWYYESERSYTVRFGLKYVGTNDGQPVCRIGVVSINEYLPIRRSDSVMVTLTTDSFPGSNIYKAFNVKFTRSRTDSTQWRDFVVYTYGSKDLYVDYVQVQDAVYDSLASQEYDIPIANIANTYSGLTAPNREAVFRYYLSDEPFRSQFESTRLMLRRLEQSAQDNGTATGMAQVAPCEPGSYGEDTAIYYDYINATSPTELSINLLPVFGNGVSLPQTRTPVDSGFGLQKQFDTMTVALAAAKHAAANAGIPLWVQTQSFGDYKVNPDSSLDTTILGEGVWRIPTPRELSCLVNLSLCYGATGIYYYVYVDGQVEYAAGGQQWYQMGLADHTGAHREPQWSAVKNLNTQIKTLAPGLLNLAWENAYRSVAPTGSFITAISDSFVQVGLFHAKENASDKYFYLVNRHCLPTDTLTVTVNVSNAEPFFICDVLTGQAVSLQLAAGTYVPFSYKLQPGEGRLFRIVPFTAQIKINQNATYTNFRFIQVDDPASSSLHSVDSVQITQKYYTKTVEDTSARPDFGTYFWETNTSAWLPYSTSFIQYLANSLNNNSNIFDLQFKIGGGKILTPKYSSQIFFNDVSPVNGAITINNNANYANTQTLNVKLSGTDLFPGLSQMRFAEAPFGNNSGYVNLVKNGCFEDTTDWIKQAANLDSGYAVISRSSVLGVPNYEDYGNYIAQEVPMPEAGQLVRLKADLYGKIDEIPAIQVYGIYNDTLEPRIKYYLNKNIYDAEFLFAGNTVLNDTFTFIPPTDGAIAKMMVLIGYPGIMAVQVPALATSIPPQPVILHSNIYVDNICLEPVELKTGAQPDAIPPIGSYIYDGWDYADTNYSLNCQLSDSDGTKRVYMQLSDLAGNISLCPGWSDDIVLDMTKPLVGVTSPVNMSYVNGTISIRGHAWDLHFANWVLEFKKNNTETWGQLSSGITPIHYKFPQTLCLWNTETISDGLYLLRQTGYDLAGNCKAETVYVYVANNTLPREAITADFALFNSLPVDGTVDAFGNIYATDTQDDKIWKFSPDGDSLLCFGYKYTCTDTLGLNHPKGIAVDDSGYIWITDCYQSKVKKYDGQGNYINTIGQHGNKAGEFNQPTGIAVKDSYIYVSDHLNNRVQVFNKAGGFVRQFGDNILKQPAGIAIREDGDGYLIYVSDSKNYRVAIFDTLGNMVDSLGAGLDLREPWDICFDYNNNLYIADVYNNRVVQLDAWGNKLLTFGIQGQEAGEFKLPQGLAISPDGKYVYVIDTHNDRIQRFKMFIDIGTGGPQLVGQRKKALMPLTYILGQSYPNPWKQTTSINYQIANAGNVSLKVYNTLGQVVKTMVNQNHLPGYYSVKWDGKDDNDRKVSSGIYFYRIVSGEFSDTKKMIVLK
ncbi:MAG: hypothetical protein A2509_02540 [Candidatus Edwardsbacteria bacterium RIFOXYD12_FULL_50_11]|uniref:FlgD/Vpr Ig-like domain-containing protein n=1 Tax=Candidatus Edwardsbacteria bacterium GWF2_54_11 TaxID=1817851 RepID=A0A1F5RI79_9BACT|nr:MAG: hypothetical protein A2502_06405 [Candidatus Edwardsbacteria bacterium RifOxyC12_full_54_24]OGF07067.1 MAG: hypothetical protein A2273_09025 [Candidatus Edwardsbacteria bacterium RifOxyA12_full_54_48]OGF10968.1 MAG: hypothetical protein A3K15_07485 [Candidatus Edwardsbacteria bacterium GWE2_54_12]OGF14129.1 MAG: hypothetical protein A2024_06290 [Candidatus Edwardsbacteria bacterium GWF2_54_11]OGF15913.1 MAG: hypothetical protein A2509_02540 [Candidatus Edwardsbacteria bacterium RIFOXYD1